ncbi:MAG: sigma-54 dependent transcriptional regulator [Calditrichia bacterium]
MPVILLVDDLPFIRDQFAYDIRRKTGYKVITAAEGREAIRLMGEQEIDVVILDLEMPVMDGLETLQAMQQNDLGDIPVIVYTGKGDFQSCVQAIQMGAYNFFDKEEVNLEKLVREIENGVERRRLINENRQLREKVRENSSLVGESRPMKDLRLQISKVARVPSNILIQGESGTGKELVAREIYHQSVRADKPFVALNCAALPENLVESELFGFEKGAFSGAVKTTKGKFEAAHKGTLFLDEIADMPLTTQAKLLRVLEESEVSRLGSQGEVIKVDVRVLSATHRNLEEEIGQGRFRQDLYFRICTHIIKVPPLRDRLDDLNLLVNYFVQHTCKQFGLPDMAVQPETILILKNYPWRKNNVRELENIVERMIIHAADNTIRPQDIPLEIRGDTLLPETDNSRQKSFQELKKQAERMILLQYLQKNDWHITRTAGELKIANHSNLLKMMRRLNIQKPEKEEQ